MTRSSLLIALLLIALALAGCIRDPDSFLWQGEDLPDADTNDASADAGADAHGDDVWSPPGTPRSCREIALAHGPLDSGPFRIFPVGDQETGLDVYCDFSADRGAGYTLYRLDPLPAGTPISQAKEACEALGLELLVPRTQAHIQAVLDWTQGVPPALVGVYPDHTQASSTLFEHSGRCQGEPCSFFLSEGPTALCDLPADDANVDPGLPLVLHNTNCPLGAWSTSHALITDAPILCSTNDASPAVTESCWDLRLTDSVVNAGPLGISGVYELLGQDGSSYPAYCDMKTAGGGWTLALKSDGNETTFSYDADLWTNEALLHPDSADLSRQEAKLRPFLDVPLTQVLVSMQPSSSGDALLDQRSSRTLPLVVPARDSLHELFNGPDLRTQAYRSSWLDLLPNTTRQIQCHTEGVNLAFSDDSSFRLRLGLIASNEGGCGTYRSFLGLGAGGDACDAPPPSTGNVGCGGALATATNQSQDSAQAAFASLYVRDIPLRSSCQEHLDAGITRSGIYPIQTPGLPPRSLYCEMDLQGGGWTLVTINGLDGRPLPFLFSNDYPRPAASEYGSLPAIEHQLHLVRTAPPSEYHFIRNYSLEATTIFAHSNREFLAFVGGELQDFVYGTLPGDCNFFHPMDSCRQNSHFFTVYGSSGEPLSENAQACTNGRHLNDPAFDEDPYNEFGLHILDGSNLLPGFHCATGAAATGTGDHGRIYATFEGSPDRTSSFWSSGVLSHWRADLPTAQPGFLLIR